MFGTKESERGAFLEHVREAREERLAERKREEAATLIQACYRGFSVRLNNKKSIRKSFDEKMGYDPSTVNLSDIGSAMDVFKVALKFFDIFDKMVDTKRLEIYTRYLLLSMDSDDSKLSYVCCAMNKNFTLRWIQHIKQVTVLVLKQLEHLPVDLYNESRLVSLYLHLLLTFTATTTWRLIHKECFEPIRQSLSKITHNIMGELITHGLYPCLQQVLVKGLCRGKPVLRGPITTTIVTLTVRPLLASEHPDHILSLMTIHIMSVPVLVHHLENIAPDAVRMLHGNKIFEQILGFVHEEQNLRIVFNILEGSYALCLLANLVHLAYLERDSVLPTLAFSRFSFVVNQLLNKCKEYVSTKQSRLTQWHSLLGWFSQPLDPHLNESLPLVKKQIELLWSAPILKIMFEPLYEVASKDLSNQTSNRVESSSGSSINPRPKGLFKKAFENTWANVIHLSSEGSFLKQYNSKQFLRLGSPEVTKVSIISSMYYVATSTLTQLKMDILTGICYRSDVLQGLWNILQALGPQCGLKAFLNLVSVTTKTSAPEFHLLILFCDAMTQLVTLLDDIELYEKQKPFTLDDFKVLSSFLNVFIYKMIKNELIDVRNLQECPLFNSVHALLMVLYRRNSRRQFVPDDHWLLTSISTFGCVPDLERGPRIVKILVQKVPHILPHEERVLLFRASVHKEKVSLGLVESATGATPFPTLITVRRSAIVEDGYRQLNPLPPASLKATIRVRFVNEQGLDEAGIDQDGVFKEFLEETLKHVFDPSLNLFRLTSEERLYPSPSSAINEEHLQLFEFTGKMLAKGMYEGILVDCPFATFFLSQLLGEQHSALFSYIDELPSLDPELYKNLTYVKHYEGDVNDLGLTFSYDEDCLGQVVSHELRHGGKAIPVTNENRILYIHLMARFKLYTQIRDQTKAFIKGFRTVIQQDWLSLFSAAELQKLISGDNATLDLQDLRQNTHYYGGFHDKHRVIVWLWDVLKNDFSEDEKKLFLKFVTSCSKPPLLGFANLEPPFCIRCVEVNDDEDTGDTVGSVIRGFFAIRKRDPVNRLPTSSTCFNLLKLPNYQKKSTLKEKLRYSIHSNTGFELS